jgi:glycosyltransferase involved in cell wall biosynthesis
MKILMVTADHLMIDRRILQEAASLVAHGHQVTLLAGFECAKPESYVSGGIRIERFVYDWSDSRFRRWLTPVGLRLGSRGYALAWYAYRVWAKYLARLTMFEQFVLDRMLEHEAEIVHAHDYPMLAPAAALAGMRDLPLVYDAHEIYYSQAQLPPSVQRRYRRREARLIGDCDAVITVNPYIARIMSERFGIPQPHVVLNAAPLKPIADGRRLRQRFGLGDTARIVLYQGWIADNRGIERLVEAAGAFDAGIHLVIIGYGDFESRLKEIVARRRLGARVLFYGGVPSEELHELTCEADLGVIPYFGLDENNYYCSPNKVFEFAVAGLPFICNDLPFLRDVVERYGNGLTADLVSPAAVAATVNCIFADPEALAKLRKAAARARQTLNWTTEEATLLKIYEGLPVSTEP